jgi:hypothetical protein
MPGAGPWTAAITSWRIVLDKGEDDHVAVHMPQNERDFERIVNRVKDEAAGCRDRWGHLHDFKASMARMHSIYSVTGHTA